jgi:hypothetical protein
VHHAVVSPGRREWWVRRPKSGFHPTHPFPSPCGTAGEVGI